MNKFAALSAALFAAALPTAASAQASETVFQCTLTNGKTVSVTARGDQLNYRYGTPRRAELTLRGTPRSGNVHFMQQRYASIQSQMRFSNGDYHYIVHSMGASQVAQSNAISGLVVMRGNRRIADHSCRRYSEFEGGFDIRQQLPEDSEGWSVM